MIPIEKKLAWSDMIKSVDTNQNHDETRWLWLSFSITIQTRVEALKVAKEELTTK